MTTSLEQRLDQPPDYTETAPVEYTHAVLITAVASTETPNELQCILHHWDHDGEGGSLTLPTKSSIDSLSYIEGFRELGQFDIPKSLLSRDDDLHGFLRSLADDAEYEVDGNVDESIINEIIAQLQSLPKAENSHDVCVSLKLYSIHVKGMLENTLAGEVWRWKKPMSLYPTNGWWQRTFDKVVTDGEWNAGRGFTVYTQKESEVPKFFDIGD